MARLDDPKEFEAYSKHYTDLFIYQARQRLDSIRFFFLGFAVFLNVIFSGNIENRWMLIGISLAAGVLSVVFMRLDFRNAQIVEIDEKPLKDLQEFARRRVGATSAWRTFERCDHERRRFTSYGELVSLIHIIAWATSFSFATYVFALEIEKLNPDYSVLATSLFGVGLFAFGYFSSRQRPKVSENFQLPEVSHKKRISFPDARLKKP